jgi:hypothetical protein
MTQLLHPGAVIAFARGANLAKRETSVSLDYESLVAEFLQLMRSRDVPFVVVGGIALLQHVRGRNTQDIDLIISFPGLARLPELEIRERNDMFAFGNFHGLPVGVRLGEHPLFQEVAERFATELEYQVGPIPTATIEGLIILKLFAMPGLYRRFDYDRIAIYEADLTQLLFRSEKTDEFFLAALKPYLTESELFETSNVLADIRRRLARIKGGG